MEDTAAEPVHLAVMDDTRVPDQLGVIDDTSVPIHLGVIDDTKVPDHLGVIDDTGESEYTALTDETRATEYSAATDEAANNSAHRETVEDASESTHTDVSQQNINNVYSDMDATQVYVDIVDIALSFNTDTRQQEAVAEHQTKTRYLCKIPRLILIAMICLLGTILVLATLIVLVVCYLSGMLRLTNNSTAANDIIKLLAPGRVTSAEYMYNFTVDHIPTSGQMDKGILSVSSDGYLLVSLSFAITDLHIYTASGSHVTTLYVPNSSVVYDAAWTPRGNIVCTTDSYVIVLSITGDILQKNDNISGFYFSVSHDGDIYISDTSTVYKSTDDGMTWSVTFSTLDSNSYINQAIKVSSDRYNDIFWAVEAKRKSLSVREDTQLYMYTLNKTANNSVWNIMRIPTHTQEDVSMNSLIFDGYSTIFALAHNSQDVLMWSVNGTFSGQLQLWFHNSSDVVSCLAVDSAKYTMYVGLSTGSTINVYVYTLTYESF